jgi:predicted cupin superfamily sugar epimerase
LPQQIVKAGSWFGAGISAKNDYSLVGCFVSPGFNFADFELASRKDLLELYHK